MFTVGFDLHARNIRRCQGGRQACRGEGTSSAAQGPLGGPGLFHSGPSCSTSMPLLFQSPDIHHISKILPIFHENCSGVQTVIERTKALHHADQD